MLLYFFFTDVKYMQTGLKSVRPVFNVELFMYQVLFLSDEGPTLETLDFAFYIGSTPTFLYFDLYFNTAYAAHYVDRYNILCFLAS